MADPSERSAWVKRVLGVDVPAAGGAPSLSAQRGQEAQSVNARGIAYPKLLLRWQNAQSEAVGALQRAGQAYLKLPNVQADPRYSRVQQAVGGLPDLIPKFGGDLQDLLDRGINAGTDAAIATEALAVVDRYRQSLTGAAKLTAFERFAKKHVGDLAAMSALDGALGEIADNLQKAV